MIQSNLSDLSSVFQLFVALGIGYSSVLEPNRLRIGRLTDRLRSDVASHSDSSDASRRRRLHALRLLGRLKRLERKIRKPVQICSAFSLLFALVNFFLLAYSVVEKPEYPASSLAALIVILTLVFLVNCLVGVEIGRSRLSSIEQAIVSGPSKSPNPLPAAA